MATVVKVDDRGRIKLPRNLVKPREKVLVIPAGSRIVVIPIPPRPLVTSGSWLKISIDRKRLREIVDEEALKEISEKLKRRDKRANRDRHNTGSY